MNEWDVFLSGESAIWCDLVFFTCPTIEGPLPVAKIVIHSGYKEPMCLSSLSSWYIEVFVCFQFFPLRPRCLHLSPQHRCLYLHQPNKTVQTLPIWEGEPPPPNQQHLFCFLCKLLPCFLSLIRSHQLCMCVCVCVQYAWVEKHLGHDFLEQVILTRDKTLITGDILIDDKPDILGKDRKRVGVCVCLCAHAGFILLISTSRCFQ